MIATNDDRLTLTIPIRDALEFALGLSDLGYTDPPDGMRHVVGTLALDALEYSEQWRLAALARDGLSEKWPDCFVH